MVSIKSAVITLLRCELNFVSCKVSFMEICTVSCSTSLIERSADRQTSNPPNHPPNDNPAIVFASFIAEYPLFDQQI